GAAARGDGFASVIYRIGVTMYRDPGLEQCAHDSALSGPSVNGPRTRGGPPPARGLSRHGCCSAAAGPRGAPGSAPGTAHRGGALRTGPARPPPAPRTPDVAGSIRR